MLLMATSQKNRARSRPSQRTQRVSRPSSPNSSTSGVSCSTTRLARHVHKALNCTRTASAMRHKRLRASRTLGETMSLNPHSWLVDAVKDGCLMSTQYHHGPASEGVKCDRKVDDSARAEQASTHSHCSPATGARGALATWTTHSTFYPSYLHSLSTEKKSSRQPTTNTTSIRSSRSTRRLVNGAINRTASRELRAEIIIERQEEKERKTKREREKRAKREKRASQREYERAREREKEKN